MGIHITFDTIDDLFGLLGQSKEVACSQRRLEKAVADLSTDFANLGTQVTRIINDVAAVLERLKNQPNITAEQQTQFESQITALQGAADQLEAVIEAAPVDPNQPPA